MTDDSLIEAMARSILAHIVEGAEVVTQGDDWKAFEGEAKAALAVARPIIEAQERERCANKAFQAWLDGIPAPEIAAAIRETGDE